MRCFGLDVNLASTDQTGVSKPHATSGGARGGVGATTAGDGACATGATGEGATGGGAGASTSIACCAWTAGGGASTSMPSTGTRRQT